MIGDWGEVVTR